MQPANPAFAPFLLTYHRRNQLRNPEKNSKKLLWIRKFAFVLHQHQLRNPEKVSKSHLLLRKFAFLLRLHQLQNPEKVSKNLLLLMWIRKLAFLLRHHQLRNTESDLKDHLLFLRKFAFVLHHDRNQLRNPEKVTCCRSENLPKSKTFRSHGDFQVETSSGSQKKSRKATSCCSENSHSSFTTIETCSGIQKAT